QTPLQKLQQELQAEIASGNVTAGDQDALSSALTDIDSSLSAGRQTGTAKASPDDMKSRIDDLIDAQVASGKLTTDQATELQGIFQSAFSGVGGPRGAGGPPPGGPGGPPPSDSVSTDSTDSADSTDDVSDILQKFLASLQESLSASSTSYSASGGSSTAASSKVSFSALLIDYQT
ncbi:MAG: hypothetical protein ABWY82_19720, partial [Tardiphaga sp.]